MIFEHTISSSNLVLLFVALWFILWGDLFYVLPCVILFLCFSVLLALRLPRLGKRELILVLFVCLFTLCLFGFVSFLFLLVSGRGYGLWLWRSLGFSLTIFFFFFFFFFFTWHACLGHRAIITGKNPIPLLKEGTNVSKKPFLVYFTRINILLEQMANTLSSSFASPFRNLGWSLSGPKAFEIFNKNLKGCLWTQRTHHR